jgi:lipopolysaccharide export system ATP-binding protein
VKRYSGRTVVDRLNLFVRAGEIVGLLGRNGAGKTTTFRIVVGMIDPAEGRVWFDGSDVTRMAMFKRAQRGMGYLSQEPSVFQRLSVRDNLLAILETVRGLSRRDRLHQAAQLLEQFQLVTQQHQMARTLSGGERRKLEIARALITNPKLIMLDEPFSGVDPKAVEDLQAEILRLKRERGIAILLTDHNVRETLRVTDRSYIIHDGHQLAEGEPRDLVRDPIVRNTYLGSSFRGDEFDASLPGAEGDVEPVVSATAETSNASAAEASSASSGGSTSTSQPSSPWPRAATSPDAYNPPAPGVASPDQDGPASEDEGSRPG